MLAAEWVGAPLDARPLGAADGPARREAVRSAPASGSCGARLVAAGFAPGSASRCVILGLAGRGGRERQRGERSRGHGTGSKRSERGFALGIRQTSVPLGGRSPLSSPAVDATSATSRSASSSSACVCVHGRRRGARRAARASRRERRGETRRRRGRCATARSGSSARPSGCYVIAQIAVISFVVPVPPRRARLLRPARRRPCSPPSRSARPAPRIAAGRWPTRAEPASGCSGCSVSGGGRDRRATRSSPARRRRSRPPSSSPVIAMSWNGLSFTAAVDLRGRAERRRHRDPAERVVARGPGRARCVRLARLGTRAGRSPSGVAALFPLAGWALLAPLAGR